MADDSLQRIAAVPGVALDLQAEQKAVLP